MHLWLLAKRESPQWIKKQKRSIFLGQQRNGPESKFVLPNRGLERIGQHLDWHDKILSDSIPASQVGFIENRKHHSKANQAGFAKQM